MSARSSSGGRMSSGGGPSPGGRLGSLANLLVRLYALGLRLYPEGLRGEYAHEMQAVFGLKAAEAAQKSAWALFVMAWREARDLPPAAAVAHLHANGGRMQTLFPASSDRTPWPTALLSLLPFLIAGPLGVFLSYRPGWMAEERSILHFWFLLACFLAVAGGLVLGAVKKFPRWSYPYAVYVAFSLYSLGMFTSYQLGWNLRLLNSFWLLLAVVAALLCLPGLRWFYRRIPQDWTLLSYSFYGLVLFLLSTFDKDETPQLTWMVLLPSLISLGAALAYLRVRSGIARVAVLLAGLYTGLIFWLWPVFDGMSSTWTGFGVVLSLLLGYAVVLSAILLSPLLVGRALHSRRAAR